ncbi:hypothetical protein FACS1894211_10030 [Clostridia bacterium]|nr:hypothetical protein FACS1894211_10030 [Clostridia bacterium]
MEQSEKLNNYKKVEIDGETYIKLVDSWVDSMYITPPTTVLRKLLETEFAGIDIAAIEIKRLKAMISESKNAECYPMCLKFVDELIKRSLLSRDISEVTYCIPIKTACLRKINQPEDAIRFCEDMQRTHGKDILTIASLTSLAAAYCDIDEWDLALKTANRAYAMQGGGVGYTNELSMVFKRIEANTKK